MPIPYTVPNGHVDAVEDELLEESALAFAQRATQVVASGAVRVVLDAFAVQKTRAAARAVDHLRPIDLRALEHHCIRFGGGRRRSRRALLFDRSLSRSGRCSRSKEVGDRLGAAAFAVALAAGAASAAAIGGRSSFGDEALHEQLEAGTIERPDALETHAAVD